MNCRGLFFFTQTWLKLLVFLVGLSLPAPVLRSEPQGLVHMKQARGNSFIKLSGLALNLSRVTGILGLQHLVQFIVYPLQAGRTGNVVHWCWGGGRARSNGKGGEERVLASVLISG